MFTIGLTGGIASGKSAAATCFARLGVTVIDTDVLARELVQPHTLAWQAILDRYGSGILQADQTLDRKQLAQRIFADAEERLWLNQLLHPPIRARLAELIAVASGSYSVAVIPLLVENWPYPLIDRVLVIDVPVEVQRQRLMTRDGLTSADANARLASQVSREQRLALADDVVENTGSLAELEAQIAQLHARYLALGIE